MTRLESAPDTRWLAANELHAHARCPQTAYWQSMCGQHRSCGPHTPLQPAASILVGASPDTVSKSVSKFRICKFSIQNDEQCYKAQVATSETQVTANPGVCHRPSRSTRVTMNHIRKPWQVTTRFAPVCPGARTHAVQTPSHTHPQTLHLHIGIATNAVPCRFTLPRLPLDSLSRAIVVSIWRSGT